MTAEKPATAPSPVVNTVCYRLHLFVAGDQPNSRLARENLEQICQNYLVGRCEIAQTDVLDDFQVALEMGIYVTPALVVMEPEPQVTIFGNLRDTEKVLEALGVGGTEDG